MAEQTTSWSIVSLHYHQFCMSLHWIRIRQIYRVIQTTLKYKNITKLVVSFFHDVIKCNDGDGDVDGQPPNPLFAEKVQQLTSAFKNVVSKKKKLVLVGESTRNKHIHNYRTVRAVGVFVSRLHRLSNYILTDVTRNLLLSVSMLMKDNTAWRESCVTYLY